MAKHKELTPEPLEDDVTPTPQVDTSTAIKFETPTSHGMMWAISTPLGGVLALVRDEAAAELVLVALAAYVPPPPPPPVRDAGWMSEEEITRRTNEAQDNLRRAGQLDPLPPAPVQGDLFAEKPYPG